MSYTSSTLLDKIKQKAMLPESQDTFSDDVILAIADDVIALKIVPAIMATQNDYFLTFMDYSAGSLIYDIPPRAIGLKIKDVTLVDSGGAEQLMPQIDDLLDQQSDGFFLRGNKVMFRVAPTKTVRVYYHAKPNKLVDPSSVTTVVDVTGNTITGDAIPDNLASVTSIDLIKSSAPFDSVAIDQSVSSISVNALTMATTPVGISNGFYICEAGYSPVVQIPSDLYAALEWEVAAEILESLGDLNASGMASKRAEKGIAAGVRLMDPRVDGVKTKRIINRNSELRNGIGSKTKGQRPV